MENKEHIHRGIEGEISQSQEDNDCMIYRDRKKRGGCQRLEVGIMESWFLMGEEFLFFKLRRDLKTD